MITKKDYNKIMEFCYKNNTIPMKELFKGFNVKDLRLAVLDGGWVNVIKLQNFLKEMIENE